MLLFLEVLISIIIMGVSGLNGMPDLSTARAVATHNQMGELMQNMESQNSRSELVHNKCSS